MPEKQKRYDDDAKTMWVYRVFDKPKTLVPRDELQEWSQRLDEGELSDGRPLEGVHYVFSNEATAEYNHQPLSFAKLGVHVGDLEDNEPYESPEGGPDFDTKEDFGIE